MNNENCIFCKIISGKIPADFVYSDAEVVAFLDIAPTTKGHTLVVARNHSENLLDAPEKDICAMMSAVKKIGAAAVKGLGANGFNLHVNNGKGAGQVVPHIHFHIIPRYENDGLHLWPQGKYAEGESARYSEKIKKALCK
ncbi:MAG: HIT family protein [Candidatus Diapherotrites archaeon]